MKVNVQYTVPVSVCVDTETGEVERVIVWDDQLDTTSPPVAIHQDEYFPRLSRTATKVGCAPYGESMFVALDPSSEHARAALDIIAREDIDWPSWDFGA